MKTLLTLLAAFIVLVSIAQTDAPENPAFTKYLAKKSQGLLNNHTSSGMALGEIPEITLPHFSSNKPVTINNTTKAFAASYDLRSLNLVTSVKNQNPYGTCWTHAAMGAIESNWLKTGYGTYNLSESNMATCHGFEWGWNDGGNRNLAGAYISRISGPVSEADDAYSRLGTDNTCHSGLTPVSVVSDIRFLPKNMDAIKQSIIDYGAIYTNYYHDDIYFNESNNTYYCPDDLGTNHAVLIVGWDDNKITDAPTAGAWIIKNSWGTFWGESGYFYISYDDVTVNSAPAYFINRSNYSANATLYKYNDLGMMANTGYSSEIAYGLIKFVATSNQSITKVGTYINSEDAIVDFEVYDTFSGGTLSGLLGSLTGQTCNYPGYYMFNLSSGITITSGNDFYIKVKYNTPDYTFPIPYERVSSGYANPTIESGVCWASSTGNSWTAWGSDVIGKERDLCIRAYSVVNNTYDITFNITSDGTTPITSATVICDGVTQVTNSSGQTIFTNKTNGTYYYTVSKTGYTTLTGNVTVTNDNVEKNLTMTSVIPSTKLRSDFCGFSTTTNSTIIYCNPVTNAEDYEWEFVNSAIGYSEIRNNIWPSNPERNYIRLSYMPNLLYGYTYDVRVRAKVAGQWGNFGDVCQLTLSIGTTKLQSTYCGMSTNNSSTIIYCDAVSGVQDYQWEFSNTSLGYSQTISNVWPTNPTRNYIRISYMPGIIYGYTYDVRVRAKINGNWGNWGDVCQITLTIATTKLRNDFCGITTPDRLLVIYCDPVANVEDYQWEFVCTESGYSQTRNNVWPSNPSRNYIRISYMPGITNGHIYNVRVRAKINGIWGAFGEVCQINLTNSKSYNDSKLTTPLITNVDIYPNPASDYVNITIESGNNAECIFKIYDITGRQMSEDAVLLNTGYNTFSKSIENWPKGIYILNLENGSEFKQLKLIIK